MQPPSIDGSLPACDDKRGLIDRHFLASIYLGFSLDFGFSLERLKYDARMLFLFEPDEYNGGELVVEDVYGSHEIKLPRETSYLYPASGLHVITPVTRGRRVASLFLAAEHDTGVPRPQPDFRS